ncbi:hypothetical protein [Nocardia huaxiensis]|uniref:Uncharacterized protein n=1 Tax=Nocardia huaxiensis TaxID=2755382 RepID=A0A7D6ZD42_9NOCA|nr:hypothetical protein [Nocardia huaxiensis]QLY30838.1 hypothetical protein H0264_38150 [Nocardia huaxiensis]UFS94342.1 hypothetical protein LPY97_26735 [Nocardia huaxiensis]
MPEKEIVESIRFGNHQPPSDYVKTDTGQLVTPEFLALIQQSLSGKLAEPREPEQLDPEVRALAEELSVIHLPEWRSEVGRKLADPTVTSIKQATRVAEYLVKRGVRVHPELEEIRWSATPGGQPGVFDTGIHITKDAEGNWPAPDPEDFYNLEEIQVKQTDEGLWSATHPRGLAFEAPTKTDAYAGIVDELRHRIEQARRSREE